MIEDISSKDSSEAAALAVEGQTRHARAFCRVHLAACCQNLITYQKNGELPDGKLQELQALCSFGGGDALGVAMALVRAEAVHAAARAG